MIIKLTKIDGTEVFVNRDKIVSFEAASGGWGDKKETSIHVSEMKAPILVQETPDEIWKLMACGPWTELTCS